MNGSDPHFERDVVALGDPDASVIHPLLLHRLLRRWTSIYPKGFLLMPDFLTSEEEAALID